MKVKTKILLISVISGAFGGFMGAVSGSNSLLVITLVSGSLGAIAAGVLGGFFS